MATFGASRRRHDKVATGGFSFALVIFLVMSAALQWTPGSEKEGSQAADPLVGHIIIKKWLEIDEQGMVSKRCDSVDSGLASDSEHAFLLRVNGQAPDVFDASLLRKSETPLWVLADRKFALPKGPPEFRFGEGFPQLKDFAKKVKQDSYYVSMRTEGCARGPTGDPGVVIEYGYGVVDWERATWDSLSEDEKKSREKPQFQIYLFGGGYRVLVVREGSDLIFYEGQMVVS